MVSLALKFIHTADWQIGMKAAHVAEAAEQVRSARFEVIDVIGRLAGDEDVDFVLVAGDVFEHNQIGRECARDVLRRLSHYPVDVYIIPGNHDYAGGGSIYTTGVFRETPPNVNILTEREPVMIDTLGAILYPCPVSQKRTMSDPTEWIPAESHGDLIRIAMAHGCVSDLGFGDFTDNPISLSAVETRNPDYLALGHLHSTHMFSSRACYSGTPEATSFSETDSGNVLIVSIDGPGQEPKVSSHRVGRLKWVEVQHELHGTARDCLDSLSNRLRSLSSDPASTLVRLRLAGASTSDVLSAIDDSMNDFRSRYLYVDVDKSGLLIDPDVDKLFEWASTRPLANAVLTDLKRLMTSQSLDEIAAAGDVSGDSALIDLNEALDRAKLPQDEGGRITGEEIQTALVELLKALEGLQQ